MLSKIITKVLEVGEWYCHVRGKEFHIGGTKEKDDIYMVRYPFLVTKWLTIYIHRFLRSDGEDHHDHPFNFWSYIAKGTYTEEVLHGVFDVGVDNIAIAACSPQPFHLISTRRERGSLAYRPGNVIHRVVLDQELKYSDRHKGPLTVIIFGKRFRTWGFWPKPQELFYPYGWKRFVPYCTYLNIDPNSEKAKKHA